MQKGTIAYFGTSDTCAGHFPEIYAGGYVDRRRDSNEFSNWCESMSNREDLRKFWPTKGTFATIVFECGTLFGCLLSPYDERGGSKTFLYVHGYSLSEQQMMQLVHKFPYVKRMFDTICRKYKLTLPPLELSGAEKIAKERKRQIEVKGYDAGHDRQSEVNDFLMAAAAYIGSAYEVANNSDIEKRKEVMERVWPEKWDKSYMKPSEDYERDLIKAGALIAAAIDRIHNK